MMQVATIEHARPAPRLSVVGEICRSMAADGYGHEDVFVALKTRGFADERDKPFIRRYVLGLSQYTKRYGT